METQAKKLQQSKLYIKNLPLLFTDWISDLRKAGANVEIIVQDGVVIRVIVETVDNGDWSDVYFGSIMLSDVVSIKRTMYSPRIEKDKLLLSN